MLLHHWDGLSEEIAAKELLGTMSQCTRKSLVKYLLVLLCVLGCSQDDSKDGSLQPELSTAVRSMELIPDVAAPDQAEIFSTNASEKVVEELMLKLKPVEDHFRKRPVDLHVLFFKDFAHVALEEVDAKPLADHVVFKRKRGPDVARFYWPIRVEPKVSGDCNLLWHPVLEYGKLSSVKHSATSGIFLNNDTNSFSLKTSLEGKLNVANDEIFGLKAEQQLLWKRDSKFNWRIAQWKQLSVVVSRAKRTIFQDATKRLIPLEDTRRQVSHSSVEKVLLEHARGEQSRQHAGLKFKLFNDWLSSAMYPSASVVDFNNDQLQDVFVTDVHGQSMMLKNTGDHFEDVTESCGLKKDSSYANCAIFADFDNDGDPDLLLGRSIESSLYFRNTDGVFSQDESINAELKHCKFVTSGMVVDINRDGLLDVYLSTYSAHARLKKEWAQQIVAPDDESEYFERITAGKHPFLDRAGPPNILLVNKGGKLAPAKISDQLKQWRNSYQSAWLDYDADGDLDMYICNDFSPDAFLRNDTKRGSFEFDFVDATHDVFGDKPSSFGMGASLGDFNSDGALDMYVSNMYSKAGHRIFEQVGENVSPEVRIAAEGNFLYAGNDDRFELVSNRKSLHSISKVGWSFGGQMLDFNNDGKLDIYVPSGLFTPPMNISQTGDL